MAENLETERSIDLTPAKLDTEDGVNELNRMLEELYNNMAGDGDMAKFYKGNGTPESNVAANVGAYYQRLDGGTGTAAYVKESGTGGTGWKTFLTESSSTGKLLQVVNTSTGAVSTGSTAVVIDDTIPQNTEGDEFMTLAITPSNTANKLIIKVTIVLASSVGAHQMVAALFQDSTADALASVITTSAGANDPVVTTFTHFMTAGTSSSTTFKVRAGGTSGTTTFNGFGGARKLGGNMASSITIIETDGT